MDDRHIEDLLKNSWNPAEPDGMRDRVLRRARRELAPPRRVRPFSAFHYLKLSLAAIAVLIIVISGAADHSRGARLASLIGGKVEPKTTDLRNMAAMKSRLSNSNILALYKAQRLGWDGRKDDDSL